MTHNFNNIKIPTIVFHDSLSIASKKQTWSNLKLDLVERVAANQKQQDELPLVAGVLLSLSPRTRL